MEMEKKLDFLRSKSILFIKDLYKKYGEKLVLDNVDLAVHRGEICSLVGPSGCGKSTLLRLILGQERPTSGDIFIEGSPVGFPDVDRGIVYQKYSLFPHLSALGNVILGRKLSASFIEKCSSKKRKEFYDEAISFLEEVKLAEHKDKLPHQLSGGMQQRVAIAQALIMKPKILLMDEPFGALDPGTREHLQIFLLELWEKFKMTIFFVTHDLEEAIFLGTRVVVLSQFYSDDRGESAKRGARIVADYKLLRRAESPNVKASAEFGQLIQQIRQEGFDPAYLQHVTKFNLKHPDSFQTLTEEERKISADV